MKGGVAKVNTYPPLSADADLSNRNLKKIIVCAFPKAHATNVPDLFSRQ
jgi:hypothetical protein